jgi:CelD/BcsL family acetyltransferase involved in cellulose biosynthesis
VTRAQTPLGDAAWVRAFVDAFANTKDAVTFHAVERAGTPIARLPLVRGSDTLSRVWTSLDNEHHPYFPIPGTLDESASARLLEHLLGDAEYLFLRRLPMADESTQALVTAAHGLGLPYVQIQSEAGDVRLVIDDEMPARLAERLQRDLPRKRRKLEKLGAQYIEHVSPGPALDRALAECFEVETLGWKGTDGSPIVREASTLRFYTELARTLAASGRFRLYTLVLDDKIIAFEYSLRGGGHIEMLKLSFDPAYSQQSPGQVLRTMLLDRELERREIRYYHFGRTSEWKLRWADEVGPLCTLRVYGRSTRARAAHLLGPVLRTRLKRSPIFQAIKSRVQRRAR